MAYFLKKSIQKNRTYLSIVESMYSHDKKGTVHKTYKSLSSVESLKALGIQDPLTYAQQLVDELNEKRNSDGVQLIDNITPVKHLGYFPLKAILDKLDIHKYINYFKLSTDFQFDLFDILTALIYSRAVYPCSKRRTFYDVIPTLYNSYTFSYDQLLDALAFYGNDYEKFVELFTAQVNEKYKIDTSRTYFDCTNFYFEIDREDDFKRKGPSKEHRTDPIVGMGLLLDSNLIPVGMRLYPGNESEKPVLREVITELKDRHDINGKTVHVADKGLNCAENIYTSLKNGDGYLFSKSVKQLPDKEKVWVSLDNDDWKDVRDEKGKVIYRYKSCVDTFPYSFKDKDGKIHKFKIKEKRLLTYSPKLAAKKKNEINKLVEKAKSLSTYTNKKNEYGEAARYINFKSTDENGEINGKALALINEELINKDLKFAGYNLLVTSEIKMNDTDIYNTYHNLWRIEETFKVMKSDLDARPVYLQLEETIKGHFLICYLTVLLVRLLQFHELKNKYHTKAIMEFIKDFKVIKADSKYINITSSNSFIQAFADETKLPIMQYRLSETQIKKVMNYKL